ncbi:uncharacterized protein E0L32_003662 [Thyridium curvatum]|uniref:RNA helicase n=1 Tax=Thyridium curvatum TaxID=1093900 RepID=A0A507BIB2_9PEZI|nr:uncharacterized protein E0L32_003662 [Thyridium curvatum]TPX16721.1 hypothetical protein E0L32_003662 [Thyridium curvatum]
MSLEPAARKRKTKRKPPGSIVTFGNRTISLAGYLNEPEPRQRKTPTGASDAEPSHESKPEIPAQISPQISRTHRQDRIRASRTGEPSFLKQRQALPIWSSREDVKQILRHKNVLILVGETGSGKSTQIPQFLLEESWCRGMIAITQPRRVAATTLAHRVSKEVGTPIGGGSQKGLVGYSVRFDHHVPRGSRIKFMTEGMLLQELMHDPQLRQYSAVIVDEVHERSVDVDLLLGFLKQIQASKNQERPDNPLKIVIMSATANVEQIQDFFAGKEKEDGSKSNSTHSPGSVVEYLQIPGRQYPVDIIHLPKPVPDIQDALCKMAFKIHAQDPFPGDILAFLTGQEEIEAAQKILEEEASKLPSDVPKMRVFPLFGQLSLEAQQQAFQPVKEKFTRKVVLATNIAETSVTVPGVRYVIDCGKAKVKQFRARLGMESLLAKPISKSSAIQRSGRAGREGPGKCYRLYTKETFEDLKDIEPPEILRTDILGALLVMKSRGIDNILGFPLMDMPDIESLEKALIHLYYLGALSENGSITPAGKKMARFPVTAPYARVLLAAAEPQYDCLLEAIDVISCITAGEDIFHQLDSEEMREEVEVHRQELYRREGDLLTYLTTMRRYTAENTNRMEWCKLRKINIRNMRQAMNIRKQLRGLCLKEKMLAEAPAPDPQPFEPVAPERAEVLIKCFMEGFALKTAMLAPDGSYVTSHGKHVVAIHPSSVLHGQGKREAIMFLEHVFTQKNYAKKVTAIQAGWIADTLERARGMTAR